MNYLLEGDESAFDVRKLLSFVWRLKWWILLFVILAMGCAFVYIKLQPSLYRSDATVMFVDTITGNNEASLMTEITGRIQGGRKDDEMFVIKSQATTAKVIEARGFNFRYFQYKLPVFHTSFPLFRNVLNVKEYEFYKDSPISMDVIFNPFYSETMRPDFIEIKFSAVDDNTYSLQETNVGGVVNVFERGVNVKAYGDTLRFDGADLVILKRKESTMIEGDMYKASYTSSQRLALGFGQRLSVNLETGMTNALSNVMKLSFVDSNPQRADDFLTTLIDVYNRESRRYKSQSIVNSLEFIEDRLLDISEELGNVESEYKNYQTVYDYIDGSSRSETASSSVDQQLVDLRVQTVFLKMVKDEIRSKGEYSILPVNVGVSDAGLNQTIVEYNKLVTERNKLLDNSSESNPSVIQYNKQIKDAWDNIQMTISNLERVYQVRTEELKSLSSKVRRARSVIPTRQLDLNKISRRQQIIEPLFLLLNQKKEELQLSMFTITNNVRVVEEPACSGGPIYPNTRRIYLFALLMGILIPVTIVLIRGALRTKVETKNDIKMILKKPVLATIPKTDTSMVIASSGDRDALSESLRMLRSNFRYLQGKVIQVTSSVSGEGKSFISSNIAISLSHIKPKICLLGLDLRKPALKKIFPELQQDQDKSVVGFLIGKCNDPSEIAVNYKTDGGSLDVFFSGALPPNPSELLSLDRMDLLMSYCRENYDYVVCDTAPFLLVSDSSLVNKYADITLYVVRSDYTDLKMLREIVEPVSSGHLKNVNFVLNGVNLNSKKYRYGYEYGYSSYGGYGRHKGKYGYGYGYGYGYSYDCAGERKQSGSRKREREKKEI